MPTLATAKPTAPKTHPTVNVSPKKSTLVNDLLAFNHAINNANVKSYKLMLLTKAQQETIAKQLANVQAMGESAHKNFS